VAHMDVDMDVFMMKQKWKEVNVKINAEHIL
jgi:hypothetical protein